MSEPGFSDFVLPLVRRRRMIAIIVGVAAVSSVCAALLWTKTWRATVTVFPPERRMDNPLFMPGGFEGIGSTLRGMALRQMATPTDIFIAILESRNVGVALVERFDLREEYGAETLQAAVKALRRNTEVGTTREGIVRVSVIARDPARAAQIANAYTEELDRLNRTLANREARTTREFVQQELGEARERLASAEEALRAFQESFGAVEVSEQARAVIAAAARITAEILTAEVELGVLLRTRDESHPDVRRARDYLSELRLRMAEIEGKAGPILAEGGEPASDHRRDSLEGGTNGDEVDALPHPGAGDVFPPLSRLPALGLRFGRHLREVKTEEAVVTLLTEQYHRMRIEERRSVPTVRVLDPAVPPERRYRPRRTLMVLVTTGASLLFAVGLAYALEVTDRIRRDPDRYPGLQGVWRDFRGGLGP